MTPDLSCGLGIVAAGVVDASIPTRNYCGVVRL